MEIPEWVFSVEDIGCWVIRDSEGNLLLSDTQYYPCVNMYEWEFKLVEKAPAMYNLLLKLPQTEEVSEILSYICPDQG